MTDGQRKLRASRVRRRPQRRATDHCLGPVGRRRLQEIAASEDEPVLAMCRFSEEVLRRMPERPIFGIDLRRVCGTARSVVATPLTNDDKVRVTDHEVLVEEACLGAIAESADTLESAALNAALYVVHELAHLPQGIGLYRTVTALRRTGEPALLNLDLAADHVAALAVARAVGDPDLARLKDLQGLSLRGYPVGPTHSTAARHRKARRMVSLRADVLLHRAGLVPQNGGYVSAVFAPDAVDVALLELGRGADTVAAVGQVAESDIAVLCAAADPAADWGANVAKIDRILGCVVPARWPCPSVTHG